MAVALRWWIGAAWNATSLLDNGEKAQRCYFGSNKSSQFEKIWTRLACGSFGALLAPVGPEALWPGSFPWIECKSAKEGGGVATNQFGYPQHQHLLLQISGIESWECGNSEWCCASLQWNQPMDSALAFCHWVRTLEHCANVEVAEISPERWACIVATDEPVALCGSWWNFGSCDIQPLQSRRLEVKKYHKGVFQAAGNSSLQWLRLQAFHGYFCHSWKPSLWWLCLCQTLAMLLETFLSCLWKMQHVYHKVPGLQLLIAAQPTCNDSHPSPRNIAHPWNEKLLQSFYFFQVLWKCFPFKNIGGERWWANQNENWFLELALFSQFSKAWNKIPKKKQLHKKKHPTKKRKNLFFFL